MTVSHLSVLVVLEHRGSFLEILEDGVYEGRTAVGPGPDTPSCEPRNENMGVGAPRHGRHPVGMTEK